MEKKASLSFPRRDGNSKIKKKESKEHHHCLHSEGIWY